MGRTLPSPRIGRCGSRVPGAQPYCTNRFAEEDLVMLPLQFISQWLECRRLAAGKPLNDAASRRQRGASAERAPLNMR